MPAPAPFLHPTQTSESAHHRKSSRSATQKSVSSSHTAAGSTNLPTRSRQSGPSGRILSPSPPAHPSPHNHVNSNNAEVEPHTDDEEEQDDELPQPGFVSILWTLDPRANEATRKLNDFEAFYEDCRITVRSTGIYADYDRIIMEGLIMVLEEPSDEELPSQTCDEFCPAVETEYVWPAIHAYLPELEQHAGYIIHHPDLIAHVSKFMTAIMKKVRGDDLVRIRPITAKLAAIADPDEVFVDKANRGWKNVQFGRMLVPFLDLPEYDVDPERYCALVNTGKRFIMSEDWPVCLYDLKTAVPGQSKPGLLKSDYLLRLYIKIFFGKDSAYADWDASCESRGKRSVAKKAQIKDFHKEVRLSSVVYVACLGRYCLTSLTQWSDVDGAYWSGDVFVRSLYDAFFNAPEWAMELQHWWTNKIYGHGQEESEELQEKRKRTGLQRFLQECERPWKRLKPIPRAREPSPPANSTDHDIDEHSPHPPSRSHSMEV